MLSRGLFAVSGVLFWFVAARCYSVEAIGLASAVISASSLILFFAGLGMGPVLVRFLPRSSEKKKLLATLFLFSLILLGLLLTVFIFGIKSFLPQAASFDLIDTRILFVASVISFFVFYVLEAVLVAFKRTGALVATDVLQYFPRIVFLPLMVGWGGSGIYFANGLSAALAVVAGLFFMRDKMGPGNGQSGFDPGLLRETLPLSLVNFFSSATLFLPGVLIPLVIVRWFSEREAGFFYLPWMMFSVYASFLGSATGTLLMKASHGEDPEPLFKKTVAVTIFLVVAGALVFLPFAPAILGIFKKEFQSESLVILRILFLSIFFFPVHQIYITLCNIRRDVVRIGWVAFVFLALLAIFSIILFVRQGVAIFAWAWFWANVVTAGFVLLLVTLDRRKGIQRNFDSSLEPIVSREYNSPEERQGRYLWLGRQFQKKRLDFHWKRKWKSMRSNFLSEKTGLERWPMTEPQRHTLVASGAFVVVGCFILYLALFGLHVVDPKGLILMVGFLAAVTMIATQKRKRNPLL